VNSSQTSWWRSTVVRTSVLAGGLSLSCASWWMAAWPLCGYGVRYQSTNKANSACHLFRVG